ncbi:hypothetical protein ASD19_09790 [Microbacterium sp. Root53]|uniref:hypothetical protein n=1 Tax=Microbacterium sp. Root53 TaxID=1736553 RepID=UPI0007016D86|nr:hypothetical protein [Microbacterium sp. Root53]KQY96831.1 hypothetical protein ASD19_09790 [Microbacterium sp. Root53]
MHVPPREGGNRGDRSRLLHESMRHLNKKDLTREAARNANIVVEDAPLNEAFVNDGAGGFRETMRIADVLDYGDERVARVRRKITAVQKITNLFVIHLPRTLCVEVPDYYPRLDADGNERIDPLTGQPMSRSRWEARDLDDASRYFEDAISFLAEKVIPGGHAAIHGWVTNHDETQPHCQIMADPFGPDPEAPDSSPDALRTMHSQAFGAHRSARGDNGKMITGPQKLRGYQAALREHMIARGWPVETEPGARHGRTLPKSEYTAAQDLAASARAELAAAQHLSEENAREGKENARRTEEIDELELKARRRAAELKTAADKEAAATRRAAESEAKAIKMIAEVDASVEADEILRAARSAAHIMRLESEELYERAKAEIATYLASDKVNNTIKNASPTLWMKYLHAEPKIEEQFKKWARDVHRIDDVYNLDPRSPMGKPHGKRIEAIRASLNEPMPAREARIDFERD